jgi:hypothetical protein
LLELSAFEPTTVAGNDGVDTVSPTPVLSTVPSPTSLTVIPVSVSFGEAVTGFDAGDVTVGNGSVSGFLGSGADYSFDVTISPLIAGTIVTIDIAAAVVQDAAGNPNLAASTLYVTYDSSAVADIVIDSATGRKVRGIQHVDLAWSGTNATSVDVVRNGAVIATVANSGTYTDNIGVKGGGSYDYEICEAGTTTCSLPVNVTF